MARPKRVVVWHPVGDPQQMPILRGISDYARQRNWILQINPEMLSLSLRDLAGWPGDGAIGLVRNRAEIAAAGALRVPVVNLAGALRSTSFPRVMVDQQAMGALAAEHLLGCGLENFAYYGEREMWYSQQRKDGFIQTLASRGKSCAVLEASTRFGRNNPWYKWLDALEKWLRDLPTPVGLLAVHDYAGAMLIETCLRIGLRVPDDVAVLGVGNDTITCEFCDVPLSSIARANREVGYRSAALLDRLMAGRRPPKSDVLLPPEGVVRRRSTEVLVIDDRYVQAAVDHIQAHAAERFCVRTLCQRLDVSQRLLDLRFRQSLGQTPRDFLARVRVERARQMLALRDGVKLQEVANACGFNNARHLRAAFKRVTGQTPKDYRRGH